MATDEDETQQVMGPLHSGIQKFSGKDYADWKFVMMTVLKGKLLWDVVSTPAGRPAIAGDAQTKWDERDAKAMDLLVRGLGRSEIPGVRKYTMSSEVWNHLKVAYESQTNTNQVFILKQALNVKWRPNDTARKYTTHATNVFQELEDVGYKLDTAMKILLMLQGLPLEFAMIKTVIEEEDRTTWGWKEVMDRLINFEKSAIKPSIEDDDKAFFSKGQSDKFKSKVNFKGNCHYCDKPGHYKRDCRKYKADLNSGKAKQGEGSQSKNAFMTDETQSAFVGSSQIIPENEWIIDSGASCHMTFERHHFKNLSETPGERVYMGDGRYAEVEGRGDIQISLRIHERKANAELLNVAYVPSFKRNLFSVTSSQSRGYSFLFEKSQVKIYKNHDLRGTGSLRRGLFILDSFQETSSLQFSLNSVHTLSDKELWHKRYGHLNYGSLQGLQKNQMVKGLEFKESDLVMSCEGCAKGKLHRTPFPKSDAGRASKALELVHSDLWGPAPVTSLGGKRYFVTFIDDFTRFVCIYFLEKKSEVFSVFKTFQKMAERKLSQKLVCLRSDNGGEYVSKEFAKYLISEGIEHQLSVPYNPEQNGVAERMNRTLTEMGRCMLQDMDVHGSVWAEALHTACHIRNRSPTAAIEGQTTPFQMWTGKVPNISYFRTFGSKVFYFNSSPSRKKLDSKSLPGMLVGYDDHVKGYRIWIPGTKTVKVVRSIELINEGIPYGKMPSHAIQEQVEWFIDDLGSTTDEVPTSVTATPVIDTAVIEETENTSGDAPTDHPYLDEETSESIRNQTSGGDSSTGSTAILTPTNPQLRVGRSVPSSSSTESWNPRTKPGWRASRKRINFGGVSMLTDPTTYKEAMERPDADKWKEACDEEITSIMKNETWELTELPEGRKAIGCKWVFKVKMNPDNTIERYKSRLVAKGFNQKHGIDYDETFSPVVKFSSLRMILSIFASLDFHIHQMDVKTAFLNGDVKEDLYMQQPEGYASKGKESLVCKLTKALYGLKQASRQWNQKLHECMTEMGFDRIEADQAIYVKFVEELDKLILIAVYVDDLIIGSKLLDTVIWVKLNLSERFEMKDLGEVKYVLGIEVHRDRSKKLISLSQKDYVSKILEKFRMSEAKGVKTPREPAVQMTNDDSPKTEEGQRDMQDVPYREAVGSLLYAANCTRPDIAVAISSASRFLQNPGRVHWEAVKRIFRYLKGTADFRLTLGGPEITLIGYSDADWGSNLDTRRSTTGFCFSVGTGITGWESKLQQTVALSSMEAEYMAASQATKEALWTRKFMEEIGVMRTTPTTIHVDNQACLSLIGNPVQHTKAKHLDQKIHFIRECALKGSVVFQYVSDESNVADMLTKALQWPKLNFCITAAGIE